MEKKQTFWNVFVGDAPKGAVTKMAGGRWCWFRPVHGKEIYGQKATLQDVRNHIARVCRVLGPTVKFKRDSA